MGVSKIFSVSSVSTVLTGFYLYASIKGIYNLMHPLNRIDVNSYSPNQLVGPYWKKLQSLSGERRTTMGMGMKVYLSTNPQFTTDFIIDEFHQKKKQAVSSGHESGSSNENIHDDDESIPAKRNRHHDTVLLWEEPKITSSALSKSFILTSSSASASSDNNDASESFKFATKWLDEADLKDEAANGQGGMASMISSAGDGIESTSVLLSIYKGISNAASNLFGSTNGDGGEGEKNAKHSRMVVPVPNTSSIWKNIMNNSTVNVRVVLTRNGKEDKTFKSTMQSLMKDQQTHELLVDGVGMIKHDDPHHITKPKRYLYKDLLYILRRYVLMMADENETEPWDMSVTKPKDYDIYQTSLQMKETGSGYPYWKPEVAVKLVSEEAEYPVDYVGYSQMEVIEVPRGEKRNFASGYAYLPGLYVDEMGLTSEKYIPLNETVDALPLKLSFESGDVVEGDEGSDGSSTGGGLSPGRWRLLKHLATSLQSQKEWGVEQSDIDDVKRLVADTNVSLLAITVMASVLHLLFEFLTFKNDVEFWRGNKDLTGLSVRALFMDFFSQTIILLYLIEKDSSLLMTVPAACGCLIALWKCQRGAGLKFVKIDKETPAYSVPVWNKLFRVMGFELQATRLRAASKTMDAEHSDDGDDSKDLAALSEKMDRLATRILGKFIMVPVVLVYTFHTLVNEEHSGWYSWFITSASSAMYGIGFVFMTPQLFLNYKLKSVAHLPWKVLGYRFVNTFIDDLFAFIIRMPTMARISCFRDDIIFVIYLWQRHLYPVDTSRPSEGGGMTDIIPTSDETVVIGDEAKESKKDK